MAQHGYLREYDEGWDRGDDRERSDRDWRDHDRDRDWNDRDRGRGFMFGGEDRRGYPDEDRSRHHDRDDRGFFSRMGTEARSWFRDDERDYRGDRSAYESDYPRHERGMSPYGREGGSSYSANPDDHYRSWRARQMQSLDRDYADYCREREQQFHQDFDNWRSNRQQPRISTGQQPEKGGSSASTMELNQPAAPTTETPGGASPLGAATLGTNNSENSGTGRGRR